ncbi:MAG: hypothetical protein KDJ20_09325, partial [Hyphomicrobiales bacterium]|nr:hypothetical protein [Hyphomicrobiales bacterium]
MTKAKSAAKAAAKPAAKRAPAKKAASDGVEIRPLAASDEKALLAFARSLPPHDLLFLPRDISEPKVLKAWIRESEGGGMMSLVAAEGDTIVGCGA